MSNPGSGSATAGAARTFESFGVDPTGVADSTTQLQAAVNYGGYVFPGTTGAVYKMTAPLDPRQNAYLCFQGATVDTTDVADSIFRDVGNTDGATMKTNLIVFGGTFMGSGQTGGNAFRDGMRLSQWNDVMVIGARFTQFADGALRFLSCPQVWCLFNFIDHCCVSGQRNAIQYADGPSANSTIVGDSFFIGNYTDSAGSIPTAALSINSQSGGQGANGWRCLVAFNDFTVNSTFTAACHEVNTFNAGASESQVHQVTWAFNRFSNISTSVTATAFFMEDDGGSPFADPYKIADQVVVGNDCYCAANGNSTGTGSVACLSMARGIVAHNRFVATGTSGRCLFAFSNPASSPTAELIYDGNQCLATNAAPLQHLVHFQSVNDWSWTNGRISAPNASGTATGDGVRLDTGSGGAACKRWRFASTVITNAAQNGMNIVSGMSDGEIIDVTIRNPNASNTTGTGAGNGLYIQSTSSGFINKVVNLTCIDDASRGTAQMLYGVQIAGTTGTKPKFFGLTIAGAKTAPMTNTTYQGMDELTGFSPDTFAGSYGFNAAGSANTPASGTAYGPFPFDVEIILQTIGGLTQLAYVRRGGQSFNITPLASGVSFTLQRKETVTPTWATTQPTWTTIPKPS